MMQRVRLFIAAIIIAGFTIFTPGRALSELDINPHSWSNLSVNQDLTLHFSGFSSDTDTTISDESLDYNAPSTTEMGYWFEDIPWLGVTAETSLSPTDKSISETDIEADTGFDPSSSLILLRYAHGSFHPFVGVGPSLLISDFASRNINSLQHLFMGFNYSF